MIFGIWKTLKITCITWSLNRKHLIWLLLQFWQICTHMQIMKEQRKKAAKELIRIQSYYTWFVEPWFYLDSLSIWVSLSTTRMLEYFGSYIILLFSFCTWDQPSVIWFIPCKTTHSPFYQSEKFLFTMKCLEFSLYSYTRYTCISTWEKWRTPWEKNQFKCSTKKKKTLKFYSLKLKQFSYRLMVDNQT